MKQALFVFVIILFWVSAMGATRFVDVNNGTPLAPYTDWATAANAIQDAIDVSSDGDTILVTNGIYNAGGHAVFGSMTNRVALDKAIVVESVNGPLMTIIEGTALLGAGAVRCAYLTNGAVLSGFTLTNGATQTGFAGQSDSLVALLTSGAGVWCESTLALVTNCIVVSNSADNGSVGKGGGAYLGTLVGCILSGNQAVHGGGAYGSTLIDCVLSNNYVVSIFPLNDGDFATTSGGGAENGVLTNCTIVGNNATGHGGGAAFSTLVDCVIGGNSAFQGGGAYFGTLIDSKVWANSARDAGGGSFETAATRCIYTGNSAGSGGGARGGLLTNCKLVDNQAFIRGGAVERVSALGSAMINNKTLTNGGGAYNSFLQNCTVAGNSAQTGGGVSECTVTNSIVYFNRAAIGSNYLGGTLSYCCTAPAPTNGFGSIISSPILADLFHLNSSSPCIGAGIAISAPNADIDGEVWINPPSIGCDEPFAAAGPLAVEIERDFANAQPGAAIRFTAKIQGLATGSVWDFDDGVTAVNQPYVSHSWSSAGIYSVRLTASNNTSSATETVSVYVLSDPILYVAQESTNPQPPFLSWATAATNIQDSVDAGFAGGSTVFVSNGVYRSGGRVAMGVLTNRVCLLKPIAVHSVNGAATTVIEGYRVSGVNSFLTNVFKNGDNAVRCAYVCDGAVLDGFTLTNGATRIGSATARHEYNGGGVFCESINAAVQNCTIISNNCSFSGAGASSGTLLNCLVANNTGATSLGGGGGVAFAIVKNSILSGNQAAKDWGGGAISSVLSNSIVRANSDGTVNCTMWSCTISNNFGPGVHGGSATDCVIAGNASGNSQVLAGGASSAILSNCVIYLNRAWNGGGVVSCTMNHCVVSNNYATNSGGGVSGLLTNSQYNLVVGNFAGSDGGGLYSSGGNPPLTNWTFANNSALGNGGGFYGSGTLYDCVFAGNSAGINGGGLSGNPTCIRGMFSNNIAAVNGGGVGLATGSGATMKDCVFIRNQAQSGAGSYLANVAGCAFTNNSATLNGGGCYSSAVAVSNCVFVGNSAANGAGLYTGAFIVTNCAFIGNTASTNGGGIFAGSTTIQNSTLSSNRAGFGGGGYNGAYLNCAITGNIASNSGGGVYLSLMSTSSNCIVASNMAGTNGGGVVFGTWQACKLTGNTAGVSGGGAQSATLIRSIIADNIAASGGGVRDSTVRQCLLSGNSAQTGGAAFNNNSCTVENSTVVGNSASVSVGGVLAGPSGTTISSSIVYFNSAPANNNYSATVINFSCLFPAPSTGTGNITNDPGLIDVAGKNFHLQTNSPCINAGTSTPGVAMDLDGRPRVLGGRIDIGAYEFQGAGVGEFAQWLYQFGLPTDGSVDYLDTDADWMNNWQEWVAGTNPTNAASVLKMLSVTPSASGTELSWLSVTGKTYSVQRASDLGASPSFLTIQSNVAGATESTSLFDSSASNSVVHFYRVRVD